MKTLVMFVLDNGETSDPINQFMDEAADLIYNIPDLKFVDSTMRLDLPECFVLRP